MGAVAAMKSTRNPIATMMCQSRTPRRRDKDPDGTTNARSTSTSTSTLASARWFVLLLIVLSSIAFASAFPLPGLSSTSTTTTTTRSRISSGSSSNCESTTGNPYTIRPAQQPSPFALGMFGGSGNDNDNDNDNNKNENNGEKNGWNGNDIFESFKNFFWKNDGDQNKSSMGGNSNPQQQQQQQQQSAFQFSQQPPGESSELRYSDEDLEDDDELPAGTFLLFKIPAKQLKPGGLRLFLMFYLMGMQNTPDRNTWRADQRLMSVNSSPKGYGAEGENEGIETETEVAPEDKIYVLEMLYDVDRTGMLQIELLPSNPRTHRKAEIRIYRCGSRPSTSYLMQESLIVDGVLDELQNISGEKPSMSTSPPSVPPSDSDPDEPEIAPEDRLFLTDPPNAIEAARESLAFS